MEGQPLLGVLRGLILDDGAQADFAADPSGYMQRAGYDDMSEADLSEAVSLVADTLPPDVAHAVTTAAAPPDGSDDGGGGALGMLGRLAEIDSDDIAPLEVPEPMADYVPDDGLGWGTVDDSASSFGDVEAGFDDFDPFTEEAAEAPLEEGAEVPFSQIHNVDDDPVDVDVDVDAGGSDAEASEDDAALEFGEGSTAPDVAEDDGSAGAEAGIAGAFSGAVDSVAAGSGSGGGDGEGGLDDSFGSDASFDESGDTAGLDDYDDSSYDDPYGDDDGGGELEGDTLDDQGQAPDAGDDDIGLF